MEKSNKEKSQYSLSIGGGLAELFDEMDATDEQQRAQQRHEAEKRGSRLIIKSISVANQLKKILFY